MNRTSCASKHFAGTCQSMTQRTYSLPTRWEEAIGQWVAWMTISGASPETIRVRRGAVRYIARHTGTESPADITTSQLVAVCAAQQWSNDHRRNMRSHMVTFYDFCTQTGLCPVNPARNLPAVPESKPRPRPATDQIWSDLLTAAPPREQLMARLAGEAGLRRAEVALVHRDDLISDLAGWSLIVHGKGGKQRTVPITDGLAATIRGHRYGYSPRGYIFPGRTNGHVSPGHVGVLISQLMPDGWSIHRLRHRFASRGYAGTHNLRAVQEALGHASVATTQRYTLVSSRDVRAVTEAAA
jgi:integrase